MNCFYHSPPPAHWPGQWVPDTPYKDRSSTYLLWDGRDLVLYYNGEPYFSAIDCYQSVIKKQHDFILKAVTRKGQKPKTLLDGTAGWGREAWTLALSGISVIAVEQSLLPVLFMYFAKDFLFPRASLDIQYMNFKQYAKNNMLSANDCVYIDPLFFDSKSSLSKKSMELLYEQPEVATLSQIQQDTDLKEALTYLQMDTLVIKQYRQSSSWISSKAIVCSQKTTKTCRYDIYYINKQPLERQSLGI